MAITVTGPFSRPCSTRGPGGGATFEARRPGNQDTHGADGDGGRSLRRGDDRDRARGVVRGRVGGRHRAGSPLDCTPCTRHGSPLRSPPRRSRTSGMSSATARSHASSAGLESHAVLQSPPSPPGSDRSSRGRLRRRPARVPADRNLRSRGSGTGARARRARVRASCSGDVHRRDRVARRGRAHAVAGIHASVGDRRPGGLRRSALGRRASSPLSREGRLARAARAGARLDPRPPLPLRAPPASCGSGRSRHLLARRHRLPLGLRPRLLARRAVGAAASGRLRNGLRTEPEDASVRRRRRGRGAPAVRAVMDRDAARSRRCSRSSPTAASTCGCRSCPPRSGSGHCALQRPRRRRPRAASRRASSRSHARS